MRRLSILLMGFICSALFGERQRADLIIFSYDRPIQLYALLESLERYASGVGDVTVIMRCSNEQFEKAYEHVLADFAAIKIRKHNGPQDFKSVLLDVLATTSHDYLFFAVDDIIVTDSFDLSFCIDCMRRFDAYAFYLRMGKNCTKGYPYEYDIALPPFVYDREGVCVWQFNQGLYDWAYPHTVDMALYKKSDIIGDLVAIAYHNPNTLEGRWAHNAGRIMHRHGVCFAHSCMVNIPMNNVQEEAANYNMQISVTGLLQHFNEGHKIDIDQFYRIDNTNSHMNAWPTFINR